MGQKTKTFVAVSCILLLPAVAQSKQTQPLKINAGFERCTQVFMGKVAPIIMNPKANVNTYPICFTGFALNYSGVSKTALFSAEFITHESLQKAKQISREDSFHEESRIPEKHRSLLTDYRGSGYDRGHLAPNGNRYSRVDQHESFSLVNIVPQAPKNNQEQWRNLEEATRTMVTKSKQPVYIITGPLHLDKKVKKLGKSGVLIPTHIYKVVYYPTLNVASAYVSVNDNIAKTDVTSVMQLQKYSGITFFPAMRNVNLLNQRFALPLSANAAYKMREFKTLYGDSNIFEVMPDYSIASPYNTQKKQNERSQNNELNKARAAIDKEYQKAIKSSQKAIIGIFN